ncbi:MAG TPA: hypothetical protein VKP00_11450 [Gemmatimonadaceae bacterium]|nr:hypothetical protein [Gemmatimonadaceae bacterium]
MASLVSSIPEYRASIISQTAAAPRLWHAYTSVFAAVCVMVGVYWDISWHMSIGRDTFWTPAHLLIQAGGLTAGISSGYVALRTTFAGSVAEREASVRFWGFRAPLGAWMSIWGCGAMLTSAPFDNWWHNAYGLDVRIISPPHAVLAIGIFAIVVGAVLLTLAQQNRADERTSRRLAWVLALTGGLLIMNFALFLTEYSERRMMHSALFYEVTAAAFPLALAAMGRAIKLRWAATSAAACFTALMLVLMWFIQLFPATPKLGPIYQHVTHMVTLSFPLLVIAPAIFFDLVLHRFGDKLSIVALAPILGVVFVVTFLAAQWPFATFLVTSPLAQGPLFNGDNFVYWMNPTYEALTRRFDPPSPGSWPLAAHLLIAMGIATVTSALGLLRGRWMTRVRR